MSFQDVLARDMAHIITRTDSEFGVTVDYWASDADILVDDADATVRGIRLESAGDRRDDGDGQNARRDVSVMIAKAELAAVDTKGWIAINGDTFSIRQVSDADGATWKIHACMDESFEYGRGDAMYGG